MMLDFMLEHDRGAIWAFMGAGKTGAVATAAELISMVDDSPWLVVGPKRVAENTWSREVLKWEHLRSVNVSPIVGTERERVQAINTPALIYTTNYEQLPWLVEVMGDRWPYRNVVLDEATKVKGFRLKQGGQRAAALSRVAHRRIKRLYELTGTPSPNGLKDLWGQMWFLDKGERLGRTYDAFKQRWFQRSFSGFGIDPLPYAQTQIQEALKDLCLTVAAEDFFDLEEPRVINRVVQLPPRARRLYDEMEKQFFAELESGERIEAFNSAARSQKLLQMANGAVYLEPHSPEWKETHEVKIEALDEIIEEAGGEPVLVAYNFQSDLARLMKAFPKAINVGTRQGLKDAQAGKGTVWLGHPASMGHGVDGLQDHCRTLAFFGHNWNLEERLQILGRIGPVRQMQSGRNKVVFVYNIVAENTIDEVVIERIDSKREVQDLLLEAMKRRHSGGYLDRIGG
jgi:SNF2 family DNA or RNA helicase